MASEYYRLPDERAPLPPEDAPLAPEFSARRADEYTQGNAESARESRHSGIKKLLLAPAVAIIAALAVFFASYGYDPLGIDFLSGTSPSPSSPSTPTTPVTPTPGTDAPEGDDAFPVLGNTDPDFAGNYAWSGMGSEEYVRVKTAGASDYTYLEMGSVWGIIDGGSEETVSGASYDKATNTLTLTNFTADVLDVNLMGNGFRICAVGDNHVGTVTVWGAYYGGSLTVTGTGSLTVNEAKTYENGIFLNAEWSQTCLMVDKGVTLDVYGEHAIVVGSTTMEKGIYYLSPSVLTGGERSAGQFVEYSSQKFDEDGNYVGQEPTTLEEISEREGVRYYDHSVVNEDGKPSQHVRFAPAEN